MAHCSVVGCNNNQANNGEVTYFNLPKNSQGQKSWLAAVNRDEGNVASNVFVSIILKTDVLIKPVFFRGTNKKFDFNSYSNIITTQQIWTPGKTSEIKAKQKEKEDVKLWNRVWYHKSNRF